MIETIPGVLRATAQRLGDKTALVSLTDAPMSFATLDAMADQFAKALMGDGMKAGDRVGIWAPNQWEWVAAAVGAQRAGGVMVPLIVRFRAGEVTDIINRANVRYLVSAGDYIGLHYPSMLRDEVLPSLERVIVLRADESKLSGREESWDRFIARGETISNAALHEREAGVTPDSISDIMFTSGTTGRPKGAVFKHVGAVRAARVMETFMSMTDKDCFCPMGTFAHVGGYKQGWLAGLLTGATVCWGDAGDLESTLYLASKLRVSVMPAPPIIWQGVLDTDRSKWDLSALRFISTGGTMVPTEMVRRLIDEMGVEQVATGYGMTETCGIDNHTRRTDTPEQIANTVGNPAADTEVRVVNGDGKDVGPNEEGEIIVRNGRQLLEYLDDPKATAAALKDGWYYTGDVGRKDADGYLTITDRLKDMYITNGFNVYPAEIERLMSSLPGLEQCAVIGVPDERAGESGRVFIVRSPGSTLTAEDVVNWCKANFANYKVPRQVRFVDTLPRNLMGKVLKHELRALG
jgi:acyl-CoA synthetase (AMP-forming)/AMP-acid ligase II